MNIGRRNELTKLYHSYLLREKDIEMEGGAERKII